MFGAGFSGGADTFTVIAQLAGVENYESGLQRLGRAHRKLENETRASKIGGGLERAGMAITAGLTGATVAVLLASSKLGVAAVESENLFKVAFGNMAGDVEQWSKRTSKSLGLNEYTLRRQAALYNSLFKGAGFNSGDAAKMSTQLADMKNDIVSYFNVGDEEAQQNLMSGLSGETEPLRKFGIFLTENTVKQYAWKKGLAAAGEELTEQQKIAARYGLILESLKSRNVIGDLARTKNSPANQMRIQRAQMEMELTKLGIALTPLISDALKLTNQLIPPIREVVSWFAKLDGTTKKWLLGFMLGIGPVILGVGSLVTKLAALKIASKIPGVGGLASGALGGGTNAGTVNINAGVVNVNGGIGGAGVPIPGGAGAGGAPAGGTAATAAKTGLAGILARLGITGTAAFGLGPAGVAGVLGAGAVAAYKLPTYMKDATTKSDEEMSKSSDPLQRFHNWLGNKIANDGLPELMPLLTGGMGVGGVKRLTPRQQEEMDEVRRKKLWGQITNSETYKTDRAEAERQRREAAKRQIIDQDAQRRADEKMQHDKMNPVRDKGWVTNARAEAETPEVPAIDPKVAAIAEAFGVRSAGGNVSVGGSIERDDSTTLSIKIPAKQADSDARRRRYSLRAPAPVMP